MSDPPDLNEARRKRDLQDPARDAAAEPADADEVTLESMSAAMDAAAAGLDPDDVIAAAKADGYIVEVEEAPPRDL